MSILILVSATAYMALVGMYNYLPLLPILFFFHSQQAPQQFLALFLEEQPIPSSFCLDLVVVVSH